MFVRELKTERPEVILIKPNVERDSKLGVVWLAGADGRQTLSLMGVAVKDNHPTTIEEERRRLEGFLTNQNQYNWMISVAGKVIGGVWVDLESTSYIGAPAVSVMIGDGAVRGRGLGRLSLEAVIHFLNQEGYQVVFARHLLSNSSSQKLLNRLGFRPDGAPYLDSDGLHWQNVSLSLVQ